MKYTYNLLIAELSTQYTHNARVIINKSYTTSLLLNTNKNTPLHFVFEIKY